MKSLDESRHVFQILSGLAQVTRKSHEIFMRYTFHFLNTHTILLALKHTRKIIPHGHFPRSSHSSRDRRRVAEDLVYFLKRPVPGFCVEDVDGGRDDERNHGVDDVILVSDLGDGGGGYHCDDEHPGES